TQLDLAAEFAGSVNVKRGSSRPSTEDAVTGLQHEIEALPIHAESPTYRQLIGQRQRGPYTRLLFWHPCNAETIAVELRGIRDVHFPVSRWHAGELRLMDLLEERVSRGKPHRRRTALKWPERGRKVAAYRPAPCGDVGLANVFPGSLAHQPFDQL